MISDLKIGIVGYGNVGSHLAKRLTEIGLAPEVVVSSSAKNDSLNIVRSISDINTKLDLCFTTVADDQIPSVFDELKDKVESPVHCSGATPLQSDSSSSGVLYPFQSFTKEFEVDWKGIPLFVEANNPALESTLLELAKELSGNAMMASSKDRMKIHLAGVIGNNFTNHLLHLSSELLKDSGQDFEVIRPLINETIRKAFAIDPQQAQTGPAKRGDQALINSQVEMLEAHPALKKLYLDFVSSIQANNKE